MLEITVGGDIAYVGALGSLTRDTWINDLRTALSTHLSISLSRITVLYARAGSIAAGVRIIDVPGSSELSAASALSILFSQLASSGFTLTIGGFTVTGLISLNPPAAPPSPAQPSPPPPPSTPPPHQPPAPPQPPASPPPAGEPARTAAVLGGATALGVVVTLAFRLTIRREHSSCSDLLFDVWDICLNAVDVGTDALFIIEV